MLESKTAWLLCLTLACTLPARPARPAHPALRGPLESGQGPAGVNPVAPVASAAKDGSKDPAKDGAKEPSALDKAYVALQQEFGVAIADHGLRMAQARDANLPRERWPEPPSVVYYPRFEELAAQDQPEALRWCLSAVASIGLPPETVIEKKRELYARTVATCADAPWMRDVARALTNETGAGSTGAAALAAGTLGLDETLALLAEIEKKSKTPAIQAAALLETATILARGARPGDADKAHAVYESVLAKYPGTDSARTAQAQLLQVSVQVGKPVPDFSARDIDGVEFKLRDYRGKVVVLDFWGFW
jgi:hypothetical protein